VATLNDDDKRTLELSHKLRDIMRILEGLSLHEIEVMLANIRVSVEQDTLLILIQPDNIKFQNLELSR